MNCRELLRWMLIVGLIIAAATGLMLFGILAPCDYWRYASAADVPARCLRELTQ